MTEVPDYLLKRSRERRAALGLGNGGGDEDAASDEAPSPGAAAPAAAAGSEAPAAAPAVPEPAAAPAVAEEPVYVKPIPDSRSGVPRWMMPVLVFLPIWAIVYVGAFGSHARKAVALTPLQQGAQVFATNCATCHGGHGEGGVGPKLAGGEAVKTFPNVADHIKWVETGSAPFKGKKYGDPNRPGGQHGPATGGMPPWKGTLTDAQIQSVVTYERTGL